MKPENVLIHIGLHKTGTTWLQNEVFASDSDIFEPLSPPGKFRKHSTLAKDFVFDNDLNLLNSFDDNEAQIKRELKAILDSKANNNKIWVMSHERLSGYPSSSAFDASIIARRIHKIFPNGKILIMIREQQSWLLSNYFQYLKEGGTLSLKKYLHTSYDGRIPGFSLNYLKYHHIIEGYQNRFGKDNVLVLPYELLIRDKDLFTKSLGEFVNADIKLPKEKFDKQYNLKDNHYVNYKFRWLNNYTNSSSSLNSSSGKRLYRLKLIALRTKSVLNRIFPKRYNERLKERFRKEIAAWASNKFETSNTLTSNLTDIDLQSLGYRTSIE
ncbi:sulfotransferase domain-containing protein [Winogradskyella sp. 3972H.M.0a.05]|uniref:sulfotransferase domain-containing protein n=1 Tax=Winogradskyella sp. 3972H.M.0a.05 TaxID=2950277 RepID=UPI00339B4A94